MPEHRFSDWLLARAPLALATATLLSAFAFAASRESGPTPSLLFWLALPLLLAAGVLAGLFVLEAPWREWRRAPPLPAETPEEVP